MIRVDTLDLAIGAAFGVLLAVLLEMSVYPP